MNREDWLNAFAERARPFFESESAPLPALLRCSIGFPSKGSKSKTIGECWAPRASTDGSVEIFIRPSLQSDSSRVADVLTHELCHAALGCEVGHGKPFKRLATALGLEGKMTATGAAKHTASLRCECSSSPSLRTRNNPLLSIVRRWLDNRALQRAT